MQITGTKQINYSDQYCREIDSTVIDIRKGSDSWQIVLDRTIFYPEGGGQPGDRGQIGGCEVMDTRKRDGEIQHILQAAPHCNIGDTVCCKLDWNHRYDYMQQHTGQHILSGVMYTALGIQTVSVHQGESYLTIETDREEITAAEIREIEERANHVINLNIPVTTERVPEEEAAALELRRDLKVSGTIRLVTIGSHDRVACGGMHTATSSEVRLVLWIGSEKIRGHVRLYWKVGDRAFADFRLKTQVTAKLTDIFSAPLDELVLQAEKRTDQLRTARSRVTELENSLAALMMQQAVEQEPAEGLAVITGEYSTEYPGILKLLVRNIPQERAVIFCGVQAQEDSQTLLWAMAASEAVGDRLDFNLLRRELLPLINGKGGGKPPVWQGRGEQTGEVRTFLDRFRAIMSDAD